MVYASIGSCTESYLYPFNRIFTGIYMRFECGRAATAPIVRNEQRGLTKGIETILYLYKLRKASNIFKHAS
jgi:hypothetical protein